MAPSFPPERIANAFQPCAAIALNGSNDGLVGAPGIAGQQAVEGNAEEQALIEAAFPEFFKGDIRKGEEPAHHPAIIEGSAYFEGGAHILGEVAPDVQGGIVVFEGRGPINRPVAVSTW